MAALAAVGPAMGLDDWAMGEVVRRVGNRVQILIEIPVADLQGIVQGLARLGVVVVAPAESTPGEEPTL